MESEDLVCTTDMHNVTMRSRILTSNIQTPAQAALRMSNEHLARRMAKLQANSARLKREILLLQRYVKEFDHPLFETWEADILTRLIEVACARQRNKMLEGVAIGRDSVTERENISRAYANAAKQVQETTMYKLGLSDQYYQAVLRYEEVRECFSIS